MKDLITLLDFIAKGNGTIISPEQARGILEYIEQLQQERDQLKSAISLAVDAFQKYEMDVDAYPTVSHVRMMDQLNGVLAEHDSQVISNFIKEITPLSFITEKGLYDVAVVVDIEEIEKVAQQKVQGHKI